MTKAQFHIREIKAWAWFLSAVPSALYTWLCLNLIPYWRKMPSFLKIFDFLIRCGHCHCCLTLFSFWPAAARHSCLLVGQKELENDECDTDPCSSYHTGVWLQGKAGRHPHTRSTQHKHTHVADLNPGSLRVFNTALHFRSHSAWSPSLDCFSLVDFCIFSLNMLLLHDLFCKFNELY